MESYYFTFGCGHPFADYVQKVYASNSGEARKTMVEFYGSKWAFCYGPGEVEGSDDDNCVLIHGIRFRLTPKALREGDTLW